MCAPGVPWHHPLSILSTFPEDSRGGPAGSLEISLGVSSMPLVCVCPERPQGVSRVCPGAGFTHRSKCISLASRFSSSVILSDLYSRPDAMAEDTERTRLLLKTLANAYVLVRNVRDARQEIYDIRPLPDSRWNKFCQFPGRRPNTASHTSADNGPCENPPPPLPQCQGCMEGTLRTGKIYFMKTRPPLRSLHRAVNIEIGGHGGEGAPALDVPLPP